MRAHRTLSATRVKFTWECNQLRVIWTVLGATMAPVLLWLLAHHRCSWRHHKVAVRRRWCAYEPFPAVYTSCERLNAMHNCKLVVSQNARRVMDARSRLRLGACRCDAPSFCASMHMHMLMRRRIHTLSATPASWSTSLPISCSVKQGMPSRTTRSMYLGRAIFLTGHDLFEKRHFPSCTCKTVYILPNNGLDELKHNSDLDDLVHRVSAKYSAISQGDIDSDKAGLEMLASSSSSAPAPAHAHAQTLHGPNSAAIKADSHV